MHALRRQLAAWNYDHLYRSLILGDEPGPFARDVQAASVRLRAAQPSATAILRWLGLGEAVPAEALPGDALNLAGALADAGLATYGGSGTWQNAGWVAVPFGSAELLADRPRGYGGQEVRVYIGPDSLMLAASLPQVAGLRVLDIGAGCGVQGLLGVPDPEASVLVDIEPRAVQYCALNAELLGRDGRVRCVLGDMYAPVAGERFDLIASLPPYVPVPQGVPYSGVANGGPDGLGILRRLVGGAAAHLRPGGRLVVLCQLLAGPDGALLGRELAALAPGMRFSEEIFSRAPAAALAGELADGLATRVDGWTREALAEAYSRGFQALGATEVHGAVLRGERIAT
ncbi:MAG TPA: methyltransferase [Bacillota bacterium]|nr:methyltransferase [Bacillota bacterium]